MSDTLERFLNVNEAAAFLSITKYFLYKHIGEVPHYKIGSKLAFKASELSAWMATRRVQPADVEAIR
jgi:excisionase family DNA binding protein